LRLQGRDVLHALQGRDVLHGLDEPMCGDKAACDPACMFVWLGSPETKQAVSLSVSGFHGLQKTSCDSYKFLYMLLRIQNEWRNTKTETATRKRHKNRNSNNKKKHE